MADPIQRAQAGTPFRPSASAWNRMLDAARRLDSGAGLPGGAAVPHCLVRVRNDTGADLPAFSVLALGASILDITVPLRVSPAPMFEGTTPAATSDAFAILIEPALEDKFALAAVAGVVPVEVNVTDAGHKYATPTAASSARLTSAATGPARIIDRETGTGSVSAVVLLEGTVGAGTFGLTVRENSGGSTYGPRARLNLIEGTETYLTVADDAGNDEVDVTIAVSAVVRGKLDGALSFGGSATMSVWYWNGSAEADTTVNVTVYDWLLLSGQSVASGTQVTAAWDARSGRYYLTGAQCEA